MARSVLGEDQNVIDSQDARLRETSLAKLDRDSQERLRPPLKWAGGKRWLVPHLKPLWQPFSHHRLVEPLCGGLAVALGLLPGRALLSDINPHPVNFFQWLKKGLRIDLPMHSDSALFYSYRQRFNLLVKEDLGESEEAAALFYYLNHTGYNGLCRFNSRGEFNVPFGKYKKVNYATDLTAYQPVFAAWEFRTGDFADLPLAPDDFVYADPPYDVEFTQYAKEGFRWADQERLAEWLAAHRGPVVLSNQATDRIVDLYQRLGFELQFFSAPRMISCNGDRTRAKEVLALKGF